jgi:hypothetical protein
MTSSGSILIDSKKMLGIEEDYDAFDQELILHINSIFSTLNQLGVGDPEGFSISGDHDTWESFIGEIRTDLQNVRSYVYLRLRLLFDPPSNSFLVSSLQRQVEEMEWRINVQVETPSKEVSYHEWPNTTALRSARDEMGRST